MPHLNDRIAQFKQGIPGIPKQAKSRLTKLDQFVKGLGGS
jgi:hypothetical protein